MKVSCSLLIEAGFVLAAAAGIMGAAQQLPPIEPPKPMPSAHGDSPTIRVTTNEVLVPTLVEKPHGGGIVYGLKQSDFVVEDNGVPQKIHVQEELDTAPIALVVAMEEGRAGWLEFQKLGKLGPLLDTFLTDPRSQAALVGFSSKPRLIQDYTHSEEELAAKLQDTGAGRWRRGDSGHDQLWGGSAGGSAQELSAGAAADQRRARPREQAHQAGATGEQDWKIGCAGADRVVFSDFQAQFAHDIKDSATSER